MWPCAEPERPLAFSVAPFGEVVISRHTAIIAGYGRIKAVAARRFIPERQRHAQSQSFCIQETVEREKSSCCVGGMSLAAMTLFGASKADASIKPPFTFMPSNTHTFPFKVTSVTPNATVNRTKGLVLTVYQNSSKTDSIAEFATNGISRLDPIPAGYGEHIGLDGHLRRLQFTQNGVYYLFRSVMSRRDSPKGWTVRLGQTTQTRRRTRLSPHLRRARRYRRPSKLSFHSSSRCI